jgi:hypothetical protein
MNIGRVLCSLVPAVCFSSVAWAVPVTLAELTGTTGGNPAQTAVFKADLSSVGIANILSLTISDNSAGLGGAPGQFTAFDLDAVILSTTDCATAACAQGLIGMNVFDFTPAGTFFTPGGQRVPIDPKLFGTGVTGNTVDNAVATLAALDANSTTALPPTVPSAFGFVSLGDNGVISFNLTSLVSTSGLFLYIGEVGNNGEVAAASITVSQRPIPEPALLALFGVGLIALRRRCLMRR